MATTAKKAAPATHTKAKKVVKSKTAAKEAAPKLEEVAAADAGQPEVVAAVAAEVAAEAAQEAAAPAAPVTAEAIATAISAHFTTADKEARAGRNLLKKLVQLHAKELKQAQAALKGGRRKREKDPNAPKRPPSGIAKPSKISPELAEFLKVEPGAELARTDVIRQIAGYIKAHKLENPENRREILPNDELGTLLGPKQDDDKITYFNLQRYMRRHFPKAASAQ